MHLRHVAYHVGNTDLIKLLVKRKANAMSSNKSNKTAMDLAKTAEVKAVLQEAINAAAQQAEAAKAEASEIQSQNSTAQADQADTVAATEEHQAEPAHEAEPADMIGPQIGPPERPSSHDTAAATASAAPEPQLGSTNEQTGNTQQPEDGKTVHSQIDADRPAKKQKVALSFADDDDDA